MKPIIGIMPLWDDEKDSIWMLPGYMEGLVSCCEKRDAMEMLVLKISIKTNTSILGICRGIQFINAALGGSLYQDLEIQHPSSVEHHQQPPYEKPIHEITLTKSSPLQNCLQIDTLQVNSYHHQAVKELAAQLQVMATSPDGLVEALYMPTHKFLWAVQWHPEFSYKTDINSRKIFKSFIDSTQQKNSLQSD